MEMIPVVINKAVRDIYEKIPMKVLIVEAVLLGLYLYSASLVYSFSKPTFASLLLLYLMGNFFILCSYVKPSALLRSIGILTVVFLEIIFLFFLFPGLLSRLRGATVIHLGTATLVSPMSVQLRTVSQTALGFILPIISVGYSLISGWKRSPQS